MADPKLTVGSMLTTARRPDAPVTGGLREPLTRTESSLSKCDWAHPQRSSYASPSWRRGTVPDHVICAATVAGRTGSTLGDESIGELVNESTFYRDHWGVDRRRPVGGVGAVVRLARAVRRRSPWRPGPGRRRCGSGSRVRSGFVTRAIAQRVGPSGHVHGLDVNVDFVASAQRHATEFGVNVWTTIHHASDENIPLPDGSVDRVLVMFSSMSQTPSAR